MIDLGVGEGEEVSSGMVEGLADELDGVGFGEFEVRGVEFEVPWRLGDRVVEDVGEPLLVAWVPGW